MPASRGGIPVSPPKEGNKFYLPVLSGGRVYLPENSITPSSTEPYLSITMSSA